jgi:CheY-like chemotaxis protein
MAVYLEGVQMKNVLVIEDDDHIREALAASLGAHLKDCNILTAANGKEGLGILGSVSLDLVLTDLQMPVLDGYEVIEYKNRNFPHVPLVVMTADHASKVREKLNALGISQYIEKPFDFDEVTGKILDKLADTSGVVDGLDPSQV